MLLRKKRKKNKVTERKSGEKFRVSSGKLSKIKVAKHFPNHFSVGCLKRNFCCPKKPGIWFKQIRQFHWYWDDERKIIELLCCTWTREESRENRDCSLNFPSFSDAWWKARSIRHSGRLSLALIQWEIGKKKAWMKFKKERNLRCSLLRKKIHKYHIYVF